MEVAAALACVYAMLSDEKTGQVDSGQSGGAWSAAARLEGVRQARIVAPTQLPPRRLWNFFAWLAIAIAAVNLCCLPAHSLMESEQLSPALSTEPEIKIGLACAVASVEIYMPDGGLLQNPQSGACLAALDAGTRLELSCLPEGVTFRCHGGNQPEDNNAASLSTVLPGSGEVKLAPSCPHALVGWQGGLYRGAFLVRKAENGLITLINLVGLEDYLLSVLPCEMPSQWPCEALKAQAVAARSYAVANLGKHAQDGYDLKANCEDQVYKGVSSETAATNQAVADTRGLVLRHCGRIVAALFHSTSGGYTECAENVWGCSLPFLQSVPDYDDRSPFFTWTQKNTNAALESKLRQCGADIGSVLSLMILSRAPSMRVRDALLVGSRQARIVSGEELRRLLGLPSSNFNIAYCPDGYVIAGRGYGHGLGLSQWGAKTLAENGYNAAQILTYYYKDVSLEYL